MHLGAMMALVVAARAAGAQMSLRYDPRPYVAERMIPVLPKGFVHIKGYELSREHALLIIRVSSFTPMADTARLVVEARTVVSSENAIIASEGATEVAVVFEVPGADRSPDPQPTWVVAFTHTASGEWRRKRPASSKAGQQRLGTSGRNSFT